MEEYFSQGDKEDANPSIEQLYHFIKSDKIKIVVIETHAGLSKTLQIFNTINTSGLSLGTDDVFKIRFYEYLKQQGEPEAVFDQISDIYAQIEEHNRQTENHHRLDLGNILTTCQRIIIARENLGDTFSLSYGAFFERMFDTLLEIRKWPEFKAVNGKKVLSIEDLNHVIKCYKENYQLLDLDADFHIIRDMIWETRYGYIWDLPIIARFFNVITPAQIPDYTLALFKFLCPPSLRFAKAVYSVRSAVVDLLKELPQNNGGAWFPKLNCQGEDASQMMDEALTYEIAWYPKWKNLICRLVEYLKSPVKDFALYGRLWCSIDIEHIQCFTDEKNCEQIRKEWGPELNRLGNLALLESDINRSINNHHERKQEAYKTKSQFVSIKELSDRVAHWTKADAEKRRAENTKLIKDFLLSDDQK